MNEINNEKSSSKELEIKKLKDKFELLNFAHHRKTFPP